jgi:hypothetical protein
MNLNANTLNTSPFQSFKSSLVALRNLAEVEENHSPSRIEPYEFELLLQRAAEMLNARARNAEESSS